MFGICNLAIIPLRFEPSDKSEIVSQILFGEHFEVLEQLKQWSKINNKFEYTFLGENYLNQPCKPFG